MRRIPAVLACCAMSFLYLPPAEAQTFRAGFAKQDITPTKPTPMWGYGARQAALSTGVRDPLYAKALVIDVGSEKLALVGLDLGRAPREDMLIRIREAIRQSCGIGMSLIVGSHTHHGPVIELLDEPGKGRGAFDNAVAYATELEQKIILAIEQAAADLRPAKIGWGAKPVDLNRNRHSKIEPKPVDRELGVIRLDGLDGNPIAVIVNFAAHPTMLEVSDLRFSAEWPGQMMNAVEAQLGAPCLFLQGALGDLSVQKTEEIRDIETYGQALAEHVIEVASALETRIADRPRLQMREEEFEFSTRMPIGNPLAQLLFSRWFFPELVAATMDEDLRNNTIRPRLTVVLINGELALVGGSGEWFSQHSVRLKERARDVRTFVLSCCNGHHMYFPTIEATAEGGYGADPMVGWVSLGAGEHMMDRALIHIQTMLGRYDFKLPF
jgi:neutral ceramidase